MSEQNAPGIGDMLGAAGPCPEVEFNGKTWKIGHPVQKAKAALELYITAEAIAETEALEPILSPASYAKAYRDTLDCVRGKHYRTFGPGWMRAAEGPDGNLLFLFSLLRVHQPTCTMSDARELLANRPLPTLAALEAVSPDFFLELVRSLPIPEASRVEKATEMTRQLMSGLRTLTGSAS